MTEQEEVAWLNSLGFKTTLEELRASYSKFQVQKVNADTISVLWDTETDQCRNYLRLYQRTNHQPFYEQAKVWRDYFVNTYSYPGGKRNQMEKSHIYLMGLCDWYLAHHDDATLAAINRILDFILKIDPKFIETRISARNIQCLAYYVEKIGTRRQEALAKLGDFIAGFDAAPRYGGFPCMKYLTSEVLTVSDMPTNQDVRQLFPGNAKAGIAVGRDTYTMKGHYGGGSYQDCMLIHALGVAARALGDSRLSQAASDLAGRWTALVNYPFYDPQGSYRNLLVPYYIVADAPELDMFRFVTPSTPLYVVQFAPFCTDAGKRAQLVRQGLLRAYREQDKLASSELGKKPRFFPWQTWEAGYFITQK